MILFLLLLIFTLVLGKVLPYYLSFQLYISLLSFILLKTLKIPISLISFVDNRLFVSQNKAILHLNANIFCSYNIMSSLLSKFGLIIEHSKTDVFYFSRAHRAFNLFSKERKTGDK